MTGDLDAMGSDSSEQRLSNGRGGPRPHFCSHSRSLSPDLNRFYFDIYKSIRTEIEQLPIETISEMRLFHNPLHTTSCPSRTLPSASVDDKIVFYK
jgi:hypothetical protein